MNCWVHSKEEKSQDRSPGLLGLELELAICVKQWWHPSICAVRGPGGGQFHATEGNGQGQP